MKKLRFLTLAAMSAFALTSCEDEVDPITTTTSTSSEVVVTGTISTDVTWSNTNVYRIEGRVLVSNDATLTIEAGTIIKAAPGTGAFASALIISRDGMIDAQGTAVAPIIFTTVADQIMPGQISSPNMDPTNGGLWGGLIILGEAQISAQNDDDQDVSELQIEGIPTSVNALYGGTNDADNSGVLTYVSIRHGGANIGDGNEINGLTMGAVGSGTTVNNIEVVANNDDGIEWFGGSVNATSVLVWNCNDDALDTDQDWIGTCEDFLIVNPNGSALELDGPEGAINRGNHQFNNGTIFAGPSISDLVDWDSNTNAGVSNVYFYGMEANYNAGISSFGGDGSGTNANWEYTLAAGSEPVDSIFNGVPVGALTSVAQNANTVGHSSSFDWTWAAQSGSLNSIGL
jgi:hypothetical protein